MFDTAETIERDEEVRLAPNARAPIRRLALVGNALPRKCGLATFTSHVADALASRYPDLVIDHYAMDDGSEVTYPQSIRGIVADDASSYRAAARQMALDGVDAIWLQHEFGIFGGEAGGHILELVEASRLPLLVSLHTVVEQPSDAERKVLRRLADRAHHFIVMAEQGAVILNRWHGIAPGRISVVPHGVPDRAQVDPDSMKSRFGWQGREVAMTFGLLSPDKGIADMIEALPALIEKHPRLLYAVVGATHPNLVRNEGEAAREQLIARAHELGLDAHVEFTDAFVEQQELLDMLQASDVYVTPYLNMNQVTSGTLAYAVAVGKPVVSTPYLHARELLGDGVGALVPPRDPASLAAALDRLLSNPAERHSMARRAYARGREMLWPRVVERALAPLATIARKPETKPGYPLKLGLDAIDRMSDSTGIYQHSTYAISDREHGYCIDDNARALIVALRRFERDGDERAGRLAMTYAAFVNHGWNADRHAFRNFMSFDRRWSEHIGSADSNGRSIWAVATVAAEASNPELRRWAEALLDRVIAARVPLYSPRAAALAALGGDALCRAFPGDERGTAMLRNAGTMLSGLLATAERPDWRWFETRLAYDNARLPEVLIKAGMRLGEPSWVNEGVEALDWLEQRQTCVNGMFRAVGSGSWLDEHAEPREYDQQPIEAAATVDASLAAFAATGEARWLKGARRAYGWFFGDNADGVVLADAGSGACFDGITPSGANRNTGAESILAFHQAAQALAYATNRRVGSLQAEPEPSQAAL